jgi:hypothetical protein
VSVTALILRLPLPVGNTPPASNFTPFFSKSINRFLSISIVSHPYASSGLNFTVFISQIFIPSRALSNPLTTCH